jgi:uncharacterized membrane protein (UPF0127 family)
MRLLPNGATGPPALWQRVFEQRAARHRLRTALGQAFAGHLSLVPRSGNRAAPEFRVAVARSADQLRVGLGGCALPADHAMLFVGARHERRRFWMKGCVVGLDMLFLDGDLRVLEMASLDPSPVGAPDRDLQAAEFGATHVLELLKDTARAHGITRGARFRLRE